MNISPCILKSFFTFFVQTRVRCLCLLIFKETNFYFFRHFCCGHRIDLPYYPPSQPAVFQLYFKIDASFTAEPVCRVNGQVDASVTVTLYKYLPVRKCIQQPCSRTGIVTLTRPVVGSDIDNYILTGLYPGSKATVQPEQKNHQYIGTQPYYGSSTHKSIDKVSPMIPFPCTSLTGIRHPTAHRYRHKHSNNLLVQP